MKRTLAVGCVGLAAIAALATPANAGTRYTITGIVTTLSPDDPISGTFRQPNAEANFDKACANGVNGTDPRVRVGTRVLVRDGNSKLIGRGGIVEAWWNTPGSRTGRCNYRILVRNLPRANFYRLFILSERVLEVSSVDANRKGVIDFYPGTEYYGPNWTDEEE